MNKMWRRGERITGLSKEVYLRDYGIVETAGYKCPNGHYWLQIIPRNVIR